MTQHPRDEFDAVPESSNRQGVHREHVTPARSSGLGPKIAVAVLALLIGLGSYFLLPRLLDTDAGNNDAAGPAASNSAENPGGGSGPEPSSEVSGGAGEDAEDEGPTTAPDPADGIDRGQTINVLNGSGLAGLATIGAERLAAEGWTDTVPGNWVGAPVDDSVVFFNGAAQRAAAEAVAEDLGITDLIDGAEVSPEISVVLGPEFE